MREKEDYNAEKGWKIETRKGKIKGGGKYEETEKVKELSRENGRRIIEAIVLSDMYNRSLVK